jgi:3',5'-cyclic AMP phosphodiesterase CpdA
MKIHVLSDLHVEFAPFEPPATDADVVVLAGDIHKDLRGLKWARQRFPDKPLVYVAGNHEFYKGHWTGLIGQMRKMAADLDIVFLEEGEATVFGTRFLGCTLWTDFELFGADSRPAAEQACVDALADFHEIRIARTGQDMDRGVDWNAATLPVSFVRSRHARSRAWLARTLGEPFDGPTVVVTHHAPSMQSVAPRFADDPVSAGFASNLDDLMGKPTLWVHGHMHDSFDYAIKGTRVICNPRGYCHRSGSPCENGRFEPGLLVEI